MKRVSVIGCPGAGKTTFSKELAKVTGLPLIHLDLIYHDSSYTYQTNKDNWRTRVLSETKKKQWIIDGNYKSTFDIRLPRSDTVIFLDYPTCLSIWRAIKRRVHFRKSVREDMPPTWKERLGWNFFIFILNFNRNIAPQMRLMLSGLEGKQEVKVFSTPEQALSYLYELKTTEQQARSRVDPIPPEASV